MQQQRHRSYLCSLRCKFQRKTWFWTKNEINNIIKLAIGQKRSNGKVFAERNIVGKRLSTKNKCWSLLVCFLLALLFSVRSYSQLRSDSHDRVAPCFIPHLFFSCMANDNARKRHLSIGNKFMTSVYLRWLNPVILPTREPGSENESTVRLVWKNDHVLVGINC